ncbi:hypothetical protein [Pseudomonas brassicacearum]|uniref:hypothetical protein n=1 Tax=Pseudomonas brassicacearum TaxID=930166 RepID=UPI0005B2EDB7|nr:hypothetical protein [Pseudomonas brassicacearum]
MDADKPHRLKLIKKSNAIKPAVHVPGQGFSEASEKFFSDLAARKGGEVDRGVLLDQSYKADHELDDTTRELRSEFALLNKIIELQEIAKQKGTKLSRKAAKAAMKEAKKASKPAKKPRTVSPPKRTKPSTKEPESKWLRKICWRCNSRFSIHADWERPPSLCPACTKDINETYLPIAPDRSKPVGWVHIVSGGAPGMGKRR